MDEIMKDVRRTRNELSFFNQPADVYDLKNKDPYKLRDQLKVQWETKKYELPKEI